MDTVFEKIIPWVLQHEGGYVNHPNDPGGETKYGITKRTYPELDIKNLTLDQAKQIYYEDWWKRQQYDKIEDPRVAAKVFDTAINTGPSPAHVMLQRSLHACGKRYVTIDGVLGPQTFGATNSTRSDWLLLAFQAEQAAYYRLLVSLNSSFKDFLRGWKNRAYSLLDDWPIRFEEAGEDVPEQEVAYERALERMAFSDLQKEHWAYEAVQNLFSRGIVNGRTATTFEPNGAVTRAELAIALDRLLNHIEEV